MKIDPDDREYDVVLHTTVTLMDGRTSTHIDHARSFGRTAEEAAERAVRAQRRWLPRATVEAAGTRWIRRDEKGREIYETAPASGAMEVAMPKSKSQKTEKAPKAKREKVDQGDLMTFAVRLPKAESAAFHEAAGPGRASKVARALFAAFVAGDAAAFKSIVTEASSKAA